MTSTVSAKESAFYVALRERLREQLITGKSAGERLPSERQIAKEFDSSTVTVGRILQEFQAEGLVRRVQGKGSFIDDPTATSNRRDLESKNDALASQNGHLASQLRVPGPWGSAEDRRETPLEHTAIITSLSLDPESQSRQYWSHRVLSVVERELQRRGVRTTLINRYDHAAGELESLFSKLRSDGIDSILVIGSGQSEAWHSVEADWRRHVLRQRHELGDRLSVVQVEFGGRSDIPVDTVAFNSEEGCYRAAKHLLDLGHREICHLTVSLDMSWVESRLVGFWRALESAGVDVQPRSKGKPSPSDRVISVNESWDPSCGMVDWAATTTALVDKFFTSSDLSQRFTGVVALNDRVASEFMRQARRRGFRVPEDFSVVGFDDALASKFDGITTIQPPIEEMAEVAVELLLGRDGRQQGARKLDVVLSPALLVRSSTRTI